VKEEDGTQMAEKKPPMQFKWDFVVNLSPHSGDTWEFSVGSGGEAVVKLFWGPKPREGHAAPLYGAVVLTRQVDDSVRAAFESLATYKVPAGSKPRSKWPDYLPEYVDHAGNISRKLGSFPAHVLPDDIQECMALAKEALARYSRTIVSVLRWRYNLSGQHRALKSRGESLHSKFWTLDGKEWFNLPLETDVLILGQSGNLPVSAELRSEIERLVEAGAQEDDCRAAERRGGALPEAAPACATRLGAVECPVRPDQPRLSG
jgi:hypothetical protein